MRIPYTKLSDDTLQGIVEEYVSREGTEYGSRDYSLDEKVKQVLAQIHCGDVVIEFDPDSQSCQLLALNID